MEAEGPLANCQKEASLRSDYGRCGGLQKGIANEKLSS